MCQLLFQDIEVNKTDKVLGAWSLPRWRRNRRRCPSKVVDGLAWGDVWRETHGGGGDLGGGPFGRDLREGGKSLNPGPRQRGPEFKEEQEAV